VANANNIIVGAATITFDSTDIGYTKGGVEIRYEPEYIDIMADQAVGVVAKRRSLERLYVKTTVLEVTLQRIIDAFNYPAANLSGSTLTLGYNDSCTIQTTALVLTGKGPSCGTRTFSFPSCIAFGNRTYTMSREEEVAFEIEFECMKDSSGNFGTIIDS